MREWNKYRISDIRVKHVACTPPEEAGRNARRRGDAQGAWEAAWGRHSAGMTASTIKCWPKSASKTTYRWLRDSKQQPITTGPPAECCINGGNMCFVISITVNGFEISIWKTVFLLCPNKWANIIGSELALDEHICLKLCCDYYNTVQSGFAPQYCICRYCGIHDFYQTQRVCWVNNF